MMKDIVILGASGFGSQVAFVLECLNTENKNWEILGYLDDDQDKHGSILYDYPVLGAMNWCEAYAGDLSVILGIGYPKVKAAIINKLLQYSNVHYPKIIHPSAILSRNVELGRGLLVCELNVIKTNIKIGDFVTLNSGVIIGHDVIIEDYVSLMPSVKISGEVKIGAGTFIGSNATVLQGVTIGENAVIGGGAVVTKDIPDNSTAVGIPAKVIKTV